MTESGASNPSRLRALIVEDSADDSELVLCALREGGLEVEALRVETAEAMRAALAAGGWDVVLSDYRLPAFSAGEALHVLEASGRGLPFIIVSGCIGEEAAVALMKAGAHDFVMKGNYARLIPAIRRGLAETATRRRLDLAQSEIVRSHRQLAALTAHLQNAKDQERARIAREIHDELGSVLVAVRFELVALQARLPEDLHAKVNAIGHLLERGTEAAVRIINDLRPAILDLGLAAAIPWQAREFQDRTAIRCEVSVAGEETGVDPGPSIAAFRVFQEALTNVAKHAGAALVRVTLAVSERGLELDVSDDGCGMTEQSRLKADSFGIHGMQERARDLGGTLEIRSAAAQGTTLKLRIPRTAASMRTEEPQPALF